MPHIIVTLQGSRNHGGKGGTGPPAFQLRGPCPCYFVFWPLLIEVTKDEFKHMTHKEMYKFEICIFVCQINHKAQNMHVHQMNNYLKGLYCIDFGGCRCQGYDGAQNF